MMGSETCKASARREVVGGRQNGSSRRGRALQRRGRAPDSASLRRSTLHVDYPAVLRTRGDLDNSTLGTGPQTRRSRRGVPLQPRVRPLLGAAEARCQAPAHAFAKSPSGSRRELAAGSRRGAGGWQASRLCGAEQRRPVVGACAARASSSDSSRLSECRERSERSEFRDATAGRAAQGSRRFAPTAAAKRSLPPARASASARCNKKVRPSISASSRFSKGPKLHAPATICCNRQPPPTRSSALVSTAMLTAGER